MSREIKFRVWDSHLKKYVFIGFAPIGEVTVFGGIEKYIEETNSLYKPSLERYGDFILEQYTGLKDKKGIEIYENDITDTGYIIRWNQLHLCFGLFKQFGNGFTAIKKDLLADWCDNKGNAPKEWITTAHTIIGNIYETPELALL